MHSSKILAIFLIVCATILTSHSLPYREFSDEDDDRLNEISGEWGNRKLIFPRLERLFGSAEMPSGKLKKSKVSVSSPKVKRNNDRGSGAPADTTESSKHAHSMITSMLTFVSSVMNFGRSFIKDQ